ncbi:MAG: sigma-70 family RNA polymerase sigma factor [Polyangiaceae bacterium]
MNRLDIGVSDAALVRALNEGHPDAPGVAVKRFSPHVKSALWQAFRHVDELQDLEQEVFLCLFRELRTLREPSLLRAFVLGITLNTVRAERRRRHKRGIIRLEGDMDSVEVAGVNGQVVARYALMRLERVLLRLRKRERRSFVLRFVEGMGLSEVAVALGISLATARRSVSRAFQRVQLWASRDPYLNDYCRSLWDRSCRLSTPSGLAR